MKCLIFIYLFIYLFIYSFIHLPFVDKLEKALANTSQPTYKSHYKNDKIRNVKNETKLKSETSFYQKKFSNSFNIKYSII